MSPLLNKFFLIVLLLLFCSESRAQQQDIPSMIKAWALSDTSQTHAAEHSYAYLKLPGGEAAYLKNMPLLYEYLEKHPNKRLQARIIMYEILGKSEFHYPLVKADTINIGKALQIAHQLNDEQLMAEIYAHQGQLNLNNDYLLYNLKAVELQQKIGFDHFSYVHNRFFSISFALYRTTDYRQSINYGLKCLSFKNIEVSRWDPRVYIFQLDIIGASYKNLQQYDSAGYYYQRILDTLYARPDKDPRVQKLWTAIAKGNIGFILARQHQYDQALPLIYEHLQVGIDQQQWNNAALAQNVLSDIWFHKKEYIKAIAGWKKAYKWAMVSQTPDNAIYATKCISKAYRIIKNHDSAFFYNTLYHQHKDSLQIWLNKQRLSAVSAKITFDNTLNRLEKTNAMLFEERLIRNFILLAIVLLTVIGILFYNRRILKEKIKTELLSQKQKEAEQEVKKARESITQFKAHIIKKDQLINDLQMALPDKVENHPDDAVIEKLLKYTLITNEEWEKFRQEFAKAYPSFLPALKKKLPYINPAEERLSSLIYLQLNNQQISHMLGIGKDSVSRSKRRLKNRLALPADNDLDDFLTSL